MIQPKDSIMIVLRGLKAVFMKKEMQFSGFDEAV